MSKDLDAYSQVLEDLRVQIDLMDEKIVSLLSRRQKQVKKVVALKREHGLPVYHPAREEDLISHRRHQASQVNIDPDYIEELYRIILRRSRVEQTEHITRRGVRAGATVLIVGGTGKMGGYFGKWFKSAGYRLRLMGSKDWSHVEELCEGIDLALVSVPIEKTREVIQKIGPYLPSDAVLADITSIKKGPLRAMLEAHKGAVLGLHPLFGPTTSILDKQIIVATPGRNKEASQWILDQLSAWGSVVVMSDAEEHDEIMIIVQALRHFATFAFGQFLARRKVQLERTLEFTSPIYRLELGMVGRLFVQDASLYSEIIFASPERRALLRDYISSLSSNLEMLEIEDKEFFIDEFKKIAEWFSPFSEQAMRESSYLIDKLIERFC
jgi:chorismate mutase/prephenate dehydrogenase